MFDLLLILLAPILLDCQGQPFTIDFEAQTAACVEPEPPPPTTGVCPLPGVSQTGFVFDIDLDGSNDAHLWSCTSPSQANNGSCSVYNETGGNNAQNLAGQVKGFPQHSPSHVWPGFPVNVSNVWMRFAPGAVLSGPIQINADNVCVTGAPAGQVVSNGHSGIWIDGVLQ